MNKDLTQIRVSINELRDIINSATDELMLLLAEEKEIVENNTRNKIANSSPTISDLLEMYVDGRESTYLYEKSREYFAKYRDIGLRCMGGFWIETNQRTLSVCLVQIMTDLQLEHLASLLEADIFPVVKPWKSGDRVLSIFEHTLSEYGSYSLSFNGKHYSVDKRTYGNGKSVFKSTSLLEVLKYIRKYHYYE